MESHEEDRVQLLDEDEPDTETVVPVPKVEAKKDEKTEVEATSSSSIKVEEGTSNSIEVAVNVTDTSAQGAAEDERDYEMQEEGSFVSNIKIEVVTLGQENAKDTDTDEMKMKTTLLEQAETYRQQHPEEWLQRQVDGVKRVQESYGIYEDDPFIEEYYKRLGELKVEAEKMEEIRKTLPATLSLQIEFNNPRKSKKGQSNYVETYASMSADGISIYDNDSNFFDIFKNRKDDVRGKEPELLITVSKGKNLHNALNHEGSKLKTCKLKCKFYPDSLKHGPKLKTSYIHCNLKGTSRWNHVFVVKGYTAKELATKHVVLELVGKTEDGKVVVGETVLAGRQAEISQKGCDLSRAPTPRECYEWDQALRKPGSSVTVSVNMSSSTTNEKEGFSSKLAGKIKHEFGSNNSSNNNNNNNNYRCLLSRKKSRK